MGSSVPKNTHKERMLLYRGKARTAITNCTSGCFDSWMPIVLICNEKRKTVTRKESDLNS